MAKLSELSEIQGRAFYFKGDEFEEVPLNLIIRKDSFEVTLLEIAISGGLNVLQAILREAFIDLDSNV